MAKFPSEEWAKDYVAALNENQSYKEAGKDWEGDIIFEIEKDENLPQSFFLYLDLHHGTCRGFKTSTNLNDLPKPQFRYRGKFGNWRRLINGEIDPIQGILTEKFKLDGSMIKIMRFTRAAKEMVNTATKVRTEF
ncbi:SCP2 sterol-binding domain-containing protein [Thermoplasmatales archaeon AK]|nr:SCP2 sterol-binding domain-containing protein [Thermoplasmatales archaeon AK]